MPLEERELIVLQRLTRRLIELHGESTMRKVGRKLYFVDALQQRPQIDDPVHIRIGAPDVVKVQDVKVVGSCFGTLAIARAVLEPPLQGFSVHFSTEHQSVQLGELRPEK